MYNDILSVQKTIERYHDSNANNSNDSNANSSNFNNINLNLNNYSNSLNSMHGGQYPINSHNNIRDGKNTIRDYKSTVRDYKNTMRNGKNSISSISINSRNGKSNVYQKDIFHPIDYLNSDNYYHIFYSQLTNVNVVDINSQIRAKMNVDISILTVIFNEINHKKYVFNDTAMKIYTTFINFAKDNDILAMRFLYDDFFIKKDKQLLRKSILNNSSKTLYLLTNYKLYTKVNPSIKELEKYLENASYSKDNYHNLLYYNYINQQMVDYLSLDSTLMVNIILSANINKDMKQHLLPFINQKNYIEIYSFILREYQYIAEGSISDLSDEQKESFNYVREYIFNNLVKNEYNFVEKYLCSNKGLTEHEMKVIFDLHRTSILDENNVNVYDYIASCIKYGKFLSDDDKHTFISKLKSTNYLNVKLQKTILDNIQFADEDVLEIKSIFALQALKRGVDTVDTIDSD